MNPDIARLVAEANAIRDAYLRFWGAHSSSDIARVGREPSMPPTPTIDAYMRAAAEHEAHR